MAVYVRRDGKFVDKHTGAPMALPERGEICVPFIVSDIPEYRSPIDGRPITSRSERREDLKRNNCVEYEPSLSPAKDGFRNEAFCKKRGLPVGEKAV